MNTHFTLCKNLLKNAGKLLIASALLLSTVALNAQMLCPNVNSISFAQQAGFGNLNKIIIGGANNNDGAICWNCYTDSSMLGYGYGYARAYNMADPAVPHSAFLPYFSSRIWQDPLKSVFRIENGQGNCNDSVTWNKGISLNLNGSVGIGTDNTFGFKLAVNGGIACKDDILIEDSALAWPDYVFAPAYQLKPLHILEQEIKSLGYLPGMPSAQNIKQNGLSVSNVTVTVVQKVEELTLYAIDQQKQIDELKKQNLLLQKQNEELKLLFERLLKEKE